jgi:hypothetical protein
MQMQGVCSVAVRSAFGCLTAGEDNIYAFILLHNKQMAFILVLYEQATSVP